LITVRLLRIALKKADLEKPAGKIPFYIITGRKFLSGVSTAKYFSKA